MARLRCQRADVRRGIRRDAPQYLYGRAALGVRRILVRADGARRLLLCLAPYYMSLKDAARDEKVAADAKVQDDLRIIFDELAALRMMIADIEERMEPLPERLQAAAEAAEKIPSLASRDELAKLASDVRAAVKEKLSQLGESLDSAAAEIEACPELAEGFRQNSRRTLLRRRHIEGLASGVLRFARRRNFLC